MNLAEICYEIGTNHPNSTFHERFLDEELDSFPGYELQTSALKIRTINVADDVTYIRVYEFGTCVYEAGIYRSLNDFEKGDKSEVRVGYCKPEKWDREIRKMQRNMYPPKIKHNSCPQLDLNFDKN